MQTRGSNRARSAARSFAASSGLGVVDGSYGLKIAGTTRISVVFVNIKKAEGFLPFGLLRIRR
ncbi:hypothetical protein B5F39_10045 [Cloacibacillus sp. An23]|nr:hypothetical protein B5F39_10045 [Cloacibacillus sp. An23]